MNPQPPVKSEDEVQVTVFPDQFTYTHKANEFNSTDFTNCCGVAVIDEARCPRCKRKVIRLERQP